MYLAMGEGKGKGKGRVLVWLGSGAAEEAGNLTSPLSGRLVGVFARPIRLICGREGRGSSSVQIDSRHPRQINNTRQTEMNKATDFIPFFFLPANRHSNSVLITQQHCATSIPPLPVPRLVNLAIVDQNLAGREGADLK